MRRPLGAITAGIALTTITASLAAPQRTQPSIRDSAGVALVVHDSTAVAPRYALGPLLAEIGTAAGSELQSVVAALRMRDGRIVVADGGRRQLLRFDTSGTLVRVLGRDGRGPGEFVAISWMGRHGRDSIATYDGRQFRYSVFTDSAFVRQTILQKSEYMFLPEHAVVGLRSDGSALVTRGGAIALGDAGPARVWREEYPVVHYEPDGRPSRLLGRFPGHELEVSVVREGPRTGGFMNGPRIFGRSGALALVSDHLVYVDNERFQFDVVDMGGRLVRRVSRAHVAQPVTASHKARHVEERLAAYRNPDQRESARKHFESSSHAPVFPALDPRLIVDAQQRIWLAIYKRPGDRAQNWYFFTIDGRIVGQVAVPAALTVMDAGDDYMLGAWRDADGVQTIRLYTLSPAPRGGT